MQTLLAPEFRDTPQGVVAEDILRSCVRCGFCTATCPTYQLLGDELDGPRGRIQLIKQTLEGHTPTVHTQLHLDRCLTCRACETTCPSGVRYGELLEIGRAVVDAQVRRPWRQRLQRMLLRELLTSRAFAPLFHLGRRLRWVLPAALQAYLRPRQAAALPTSAPTVTPALIARAAPTTDITPARQVLLLAGCVQPAMAPEITAATQRVLARLGGAVSIAPAAGCCGSVRAHLGDPEGALTEARDNIDAWWPWIERGVDAILSDNSSCSVMLADYGRLLHHDERYRARAARVAALASDVAGDLERQLPALQARCRSQPAVSVAFQAPCTLQHGLRLRGAVERILSAAGAELQPVADAHLCCGSAGSYSLLQPELAAGLRTRKLAALTAGQPTQILSANIGCMMHLSAGTHLPVRHWIEWLDQRLGPGGRG